MDARNIGPTKTYSLSSTPAQPSWAHLSSTQRMNTIRNNNSNKTPQEQYHRQNPNDSNNNTNHRIELLQDLTMPSSSNKIIPCPDGSHLLVAGTYPPRIRCYDLHELSMKFERFSESDIMDVCCLNDGGSIIAGANAGSGSGGGGGGNETTTGDAKGYGKLALLTSDRTITFHAPYGAHYEMRIPRFGRMLAYEPSNCHLLCCTSGSDRLDTSNTTTGSTTSSSKASTKNNTGGRVYRMDLAEGRFATPLEYASSQKNNNLQSSTQNNGQTGGNCIAVSPSHAMTVLGGEDGMLRMFDNRCVGSENGGNVSPFAVLDVDTAVYGHGFNSKGNSSNRGVGGSSGERGGSTGGGATSVAVDNTGLHLAVGTSDGCVVLYDVRSSKPMHVRAHRYGLPIHTVRFHSGSGCVVGSDSKVVQFWRYRPGSGAGGVSGGGGGWDEDMNENENENHVPNNDDYSNNNNGMMSNATTIANNQNNTTNTNNIGGIVATIQAESNLCHIAMIGDTSDPNGDRSGLLLGASSGQSKVQAYYVPGVGRAPRWCSFLDGVAGEMEEDDIDRRHNDIMGGTTTTAAGGDDTMATLGTGTGGQTGDVYEDYRFVTRDEVTKLNLEGLIGTPLLKGYLHGYFIDSGLYRKVMAEVEPFAYEEYRKKKIKERVDAKKKSRISPKDNNPNSSSNKKNIDGTTTLRKKKATVNVSLAERLDSKASMEITQTKKKKNKVAARELLQDERFGKLFENPDFEIDEEADDFKLRNPSGVATAKEVERDTREEDLDSDLDSSDDEDDADAAAGAKTPIGFRKVTNEDDVNVYSGAASSSSAPSSENDDDDDDSDDDNEDGMAGGIVRGENYDEVKSSMISSSSSLSSSKKKKQKEKQQKRQTKKKQSANVMYEADGYYDEDGKNGGGDLIMANNNVEETATTTGAEKRRRRMAVSMEDRLKDDRMTSGGGGNGGGVSRVVPGATTRTKVRGEGTTREVSYVPKDARKVNGGGGNNNGNGDSGNNRGESKEGVDAGRRGKKRRGIKGLGFKTPFKHQSS